MKNLITLLLLIIIWAIGGHARAQTPNESYICIYVSGACTLVSAGNPLPIGGTFTPSGTQSVIGTGPQAPGTASGFSLEVGGIYRSSAPTLTNGQQGALGLNSEGDVLVQVVTGNTGGGFTMPQSQTPSDGEGASISLFTFSNTSLFNGTFWDRGRSIQGAVPSGMGNFAVDIAPCSAAACGIVPIVSSSAEASHVLKNAAGNLYSVYATNLTSTAGFLAVINATTAPTTGSAITPLQCVPIPASGNASINFGSGPPEVYSSGIVALVSSNASCFTFTSGTITAFIHAMVQ